MLEKKRKKAKFHWTLWAATACTAWCVHGCASSNTENTKGVTAALPPVVSVQSETKPTEDQDAAIVVPKKPEAPALDEATLKLYRKMLPQAHRFVPALVPKELKAAWGEHEEPVYTEALDSESVLIAHVRRMEEAPGLKNNKPLLLVLGKDFELLKIGPPGDWSKKNGQPFSSKELKQLVQRVNQNASPLDGEARGSRSSASIEKSTKESRLDFLVRVVKATGRVLKASKGIWDRSRIGKLMAKPTHQHVLAKALATILPSLETDAARRQTYQLMVHAYVQARTFNGPKIPFIESQLFDAALKGKIGVQELANACYLFVNHNLYDFDIERCVSVIEQCNGQGGQPLEPASQERLVGAWLFFKKDYAEALPVLREATKHIGLGRDPRLHLRFAQTLDALGHAEEACPIAKQLFQDHAKLEGTRAVLGTCNPYSKTVAPLASKIELDRKAQVLLSKREETTAAPVLELENPGLGFLDLDLAKQPCITVLVFFSTWCTHCGAEIPRINALASAIEQHSFLKEQACVVGIRTAMEREQIPYEDFLSRFKPQFPIYFDPTMSLAFTRFARSLGIPMLLPTLAVVDQKGVVRFLLESGEFRDTEQEVMWALTDLLKEQGTTISSRP